MENIRIAFQRVKKDELHYVWWVSTDSTDVVQPIVTDLALNDFSTTQVVFGTFLISRKHVTNIKRDVRIRKWVRTCLRENGINIATVKQSPLRYQIGKGSKLVYGVGKSFYQNPHNIPYASQLGSKHVYVPVWCKETYLESTCEGTDPWGFAGSASPPLHQG